MPLRTVNTLLARRRTALIQRLIEPVLGCLTQGDRSTADLSGDLGNVSIKALETTLAILKARGLVVSINKGRSHGWHLVKGASLE